MRTIKVLYIGVFAWSGYVSPGKHPKIFKKLNNPKIMDTYSEYALRNGSLYQVVIGIIPFSTRPSSTTVKLECNGFTIPTQKTSLFHPITLLRQYAIKRIEWKKPHFTDAYKITLTYNNGSNEKETVRITALFDRLAIKLDGRIVVHSPRDVCYSGPPTPSIFDRHPVIVFLRDTGNRGHSHTHYQITDWSEVEPMLVKEEGKPPDEDALGDGTTSLEDTHSDDEATSDEDALDKCEITSDEDTPNDDGASPISSGHQQMSKGKLKKLLKPRKKKRKQQRKVKKKKMRYQYRFR